MKLVTAVALGLGILSTLTLLLGLLGAATTLFIWILILIGAALAIVRLLRAQKEATQVSPLQVPLTSYLYLALIPLAAMVIVAAFVPPGILWGDEPHGYDVLSYHLQLPREWYEAHRITTSTRNAFSFMPLSVETHYLIAMHLRGGPWAGMYLAQLMHVAFCALCAFAIHAFTRSKTATIAFAATPWLALLAPVAYNEGGLLLYGNPRHRLDSPRAPRFEPPRLLLAGVFTGLACTTKLTAVPTLAVAIPIAAVAASFKPNLRGFLLLFLTSALTVSPWLIRTAATARNPFFPEAQNLLAAPTLLRINQNAGASRILRQNPNAASRPVLERSWIR
jgi:hypothetical protein